MDPFGQAPPEPLAAPSPVADPSPPAFTVPRGASGPRAGFWKRFVAVLIDWAMLWVIFRLLTLVLKGIGDVLALLIDIGYFVYLEGGPAGQTIGKRVMGIRVISFQTGGPIGYGRAFARWAVRIVSALVFYLGYLWMLWDPEKQCWHDKAATDVVVPLSAYPVAAD